MIQGSCRFSPDPSPQGGWGLGTRLVLAYVGLAQARPNYTNVLACSSNPTHGFQRNFHLGDKVLFMLIL